MCVIGVLLLYAPRYACGGMSGVISSYQAVIITHDLHRDGESCCCLAQVPTITNDVSVKLPEDLQNFQPHLIRD